MHISDIRFNNNLHRQVAMTLCISILMIVSFHGQTNKAEIKPLISKKGKLVFEDSFDNNAPRSEWRPLHGTRWEIVNGVFKGIPSTKEFQAGKSNHSGKTPSMLLKAGARDCILEMSVKISGGLDAAHIGFNEGSTHTTSGHIFRLILDVNNGVDLQKDANSQIEGNKNVVLDHSDWKPKRDQWITVLIETQGDQVVAQIVDGPTLKMQSSRLDVPKKSGNFKARGNEGVIEYDNVKIWEALSIN